MMADAGVELEAMRLERCFRIVVDPNVQSGVRASCRAVIEGPELRHEPLDDSIGFPAALLFAALFFAVAWGFRGAMGR